MISAIITHFFNKERAKNLPGIVDSLFKQDVNEVVVWNNDYTLPEEIQDHLLLLGARVIQSPVNLGCQGRFQAVRHVMGMPEFEGSRLLGKPEYILFHDNDIIASTRSVEKLVAASLLYPGDIIAGTGERRVYNDKVEFLSRAQFELVPIATVERILTRWKGGEESLHDDLWFSVTAKQMGYECRHVDISWKNLWDGVGFFRTIPKFDDERQAVFIRLMARVKR
jgi:hypothetical protein